MAVSRKSKKNQANQKSVNTEKAPKNETKEIPKATEVVAEVKKIEKPTESKETPISKPVEVEKKENVKEVIDTPKEVEKAKEIKKSKPIIVEDDEKKVDIAEKKEEKKVTKTEKSVIKSVQPKKEKKVKKQNKKDPEIDEKTLFIGNIPNQVLSTPSKLKQLFLKYGEIESMRFRSVAVNSTPIETYNQKLLRKASVITKNLSDEKKCVNAYIVFKEKRSVQEALEMNNYLFEDRHLRVDGVNTVSPRAEFKTNKNTLFIGNLPFHTDEEELRAYINKAIRKGDSEEIIENIHIVRDKNTQKEKGIAFVVLKDNIYMPQILLLNNKVFNDRPLRITRYNTKKTLITDAKHHKEIIHQRKEKKAKTEKKEKKVEKKEEDVHKELKNELSQVWEQINNGKKIEDIEKDITTKQIPKEKKNTEKKISRSIPTKSFMGQKSKHTLKEMKHIEKKMKK